MMYPSLAQLVRMTPEQRRQRLRGIDAVSRAKLLEDVAILLHDVVEAGLAETSK